MSATLSNQIGLNRVGAPNVVLNRSIVSIPGGFSPTQIPNLTLWLDASDTDTIIFSSGTSVDRWIDKSGIGNTPVAGATKPVYLATSFNSRPTISFTAAGSVAASTYLALTMATPFAGSSLQCFAVATLSSTANSFGRLFSLGDGAGGDLQNDTCMPFTRNNGAQQLFVGRTADGARFLSVNIPAYDTPFIIQSSQIPNTEAISINGGTVSTLATGQAGNFDIKDFAVGTNASLTDSVGSYTGYISEVIWYTQSLTTAQIQQVEGYLSWKWGLQGNLPSNHPYKNVNQVFTPLPSLPVPMPTLIGTLSWSPLLLTGGAALWLDGSDVSTMSFSGTSITQWRDKSGNGRTATGYQTPTLSRINNLPAVSLGSTNNFDGSLTNGGNFVTVFAVATTDGTAPNPFNRLVSLAQIGTDGTDAFVNGWAVPMCLGGDNAKMGAQRGTSSSIQAGAASISPNVPFLICNIVTNTTFSMYVNGSSYMTFSGTNRGSLTYINYAIGRAIQQVGGINYNGTNPTFVWPGVVCEVIISNTNMSDDDRQKTEGYLAWKWGLQRSLPATHPYYYFPPPPS